MSRHLQFANLALRQASIGVVRVVVLRVGLLLLGLLGLLCGLRGLWLGVHVGLLGVGSVEVYAGRGRRYLALRLEQSRLQVDDVVAQLVVFRLQRLVQLAQLLKLLDLVLELLDVLLLALAECALGRLAWRAGQGSAGQGTHTWAARFWAARFDVDSSLRPLLRPSLVLPSSGPPALMS